MRHQRIKPVTTELPDSLHDLLQSAYRYALSLVHERAAAEDLVQDACIAILGAGGPWHKPYVLTILRNRFIDQYRRSQRVNFVPLDGGEDVVPADGDERQEELPDVLQAEALDRALAILRVEERETLYLAAVEGYTAQEIADFTNRPRGTVLSLLHRTKRKLRELLRQQPGT